VEESGEEGNDRGGRDKLGHDIHAHALPFWRLR
jgi:hypothetical protein